MCQAGISIIVPCYNAGLVIERCIDSILQQTYNNWELILIDDGSIDNTLNICNSFKKLDNRIKVVHTGNCGVSSARNTGITNTTREYITFVDADDYLEINFLESLINGRNADLVLSGFKSRNSINFRPQNQYIEHVNLKSNIKGIVENKYLLYSPWGKLFKRSIISDNRLGFDTKIRFGEDTIFCYKYIIHCNTIKIIDSDLYIYDGEWGGNSKYILKYNEMLYLDQMELSSIHEINEKFDCNIDVTYRGYHINLLENLYKDYTDFDTYNIYINTHGYISSKDFWNNKNLSCIFWGLVKLETLYKQHLYEKGDELMIYLKNFFTIPTVQLKSYSIIMKILHWNICHNNLFINKIILKLIYA